ncbi:DUF6518 family protein [Solwaraspora sp. WMMD791]|uniref:DUF6518 family protein n=1 Tax=Solwaraspora sp. WMMD791 TaxID=3016086 RepID=UPI00249AC4D4|nr:DUF6518 family protein [Solwaraspora sp. WMMD791]WFE28386.1 DUF6518 family protein [Solwaraspora sp. WMMD791]
MNPNTTQVAVVAVVGGFLLGFLDFVWIASMPYPFAELGNSSAVWAVAAFGFGYWVRTGWLRAAAGAAGALVVAVPSYYLAATLIQGDDLAIMWAPTALLWMAFGVLAGVVFGVGGTWARGHGWRQVVGVALPGAVLLAEAALHARDIGDPRYGRDSLWLLMINIALAVAVVLLAGGRTSVRLRGLAAAVPLAAAGFAAFRLGGFG